MSLEKNKAEDTAPVTGAVDAVSEKVAKKAPVLNATQKRQLAAKEAQASQRAAQAKKEAAEAKAVEATKKAEEKASKEVEKDDRKIYTDDRGLKFRFKKTAPKSLNIDGKSRLVTELIEEAEVMLELVHGNNSFIENIQ